MICLHHFPVFLYLHQSHVTAGHSLIILYNCFVLFAHTEAAGLCLAAFVLPLQNVHVQLDEGWFKIWISCFGVKYKRLSACTPLCMLCMHERDRLIIRRLWNWPASYQIRAKNSNNSPFPVPGWWMPLYLFFSFSVSFIISVMLLTPDFRRHDPVFVSGLAACGLSVT